MKSFNLTRINRLSPYRVELGDNELVFKTDYDIALIVKRDHPLLQEIIEMYNEEIAMFRANKP